MAIKSKHPQLILYWIELIIGIVCVALAGRGYHETYVQYLIVISAGLAVGNVLLLLLYGFATCRPPEGRSPTKLIETIYQICASLLYLGAIGTTSVQVEYFQPFIGPVTVFTTLNFGSYIFGGMIALTDLLFYDPNKAASTTQPPTVANVESSGG